MVDSAKDSQTYGSADGGKEILHHNLSANNNCVRDAIVETDCKVVLLFRVWLWIQRGKRGTFLGHARGEAKPSTTTDVAACYWKLKQALQWKRYNDSGWSPPCDFIPSVSFPRLGFSDFIRGPPSESLLYLCPPWTSPHSRSLCSLSPLSSSILT